MLIPFYSPPARRGLLDFIKVASFRSSSSSSTPPAFRVPPASSSSSPRPPRPTAIRNPQRSLPDLNHDHPRPVFPAGPQPRPSTPSVPCRTSTTTIHAQCSLPDLNHDHPRQCSLPDLNREHPRPVFPAGPQPRTCPAQCGHCRTSTGRMSERMSEKMSDRMSEDMPDRMPERMSERYAR